MFSKKTLGKLHLFFDNFDLFEECLNQTIKDHSAIIMIQYGARCAKSYYDRLARFKSQLNDILLNKFYGTKLIKLIPEKTILRILKYVNLNFLL